jgi:hypothetical protein
MPATPKKLVHWDLDGSSISILNSPFFNNTYESSVTSTSSLEFINSQLVAHGFVPSPGLSLEGISNDDSARVVKCLLGMLSQRVVSIVANLLYINNLNQNSGRYVAHGEPHNQVPHFVL